MKKLLFLPLSLSAIFLVGSLVAHAATTVSVLVVAGGGGGGDSYGGGGGGGGVLYNASVAITGGTAYTITVGSGGADDNSGNNSSFSSVVVATGGGCGGTPCSGGSGGGTNGNQTNAGGSGTSGQGYAGGSASGNGQSDMTWVGGGGGGAGGTGSAGTGNSGVGGAGGSGNYFSISGSSVPYGGGGGGGANTTGGSGGAGGGGAGASVCNTGSYGTTNTGGGGGGGGGAAGGVGGNCGGVGNFAGGYGGSGVVIISAPTSENITATGGTKTTSGSNTIWTFTTSGTWTPATVPSAPTSPSATGSNAQVALSWTAPSNGGATITYYNIYRSTSSGGEGSTPVASSTTTSYTNTGLTNGTTYYYDIAAVNSVGVGATSSQVSATTPATVPSAPTSPSATGSNAQVALSWTAPSNGGATITYYNIYWSTSSGGEGSTPVASSTTTSYTNTGLTNGTTYYYDIAAVNSVGVGATSSQVSATPATVPSAPTSPSATGGNAQVALSWTAPSNGGATITYYNIYRSTSSGGEGSTPVASSTTTSYTNTGLTNGTTYYYDIAAVNSVGVGATSSQVSATPATVPSAPTSPSATGGNAQVALSWTAPSNGGATITYYNIYRSTSSGGEGSTPVASSTTTSYTNTGLTNGTTYYYDIAAVNSVGVGATSSQVSATPVTVPGAPTIGIALPGNVSALVQFTAPSSNGGSTTTFYTAASNPGNHTATSTVSPITVSGLTNGTSYTFTVAAMNAVGQGASSTASNAVVPAVTCPSVISGLETISSSCIFAGTVDGVDGGITVNNGATLTISAGQTVVFDIGSSTIIHGSIVIIGNGQLEKSYLWTVDANHNGYPATLAVYAATSSPGSNYERLSYEVSRTVADCNDNAVSSYGTNICGAAPAPPTIGTATAGVGSASVAFTPDGATTPPITGYTATSNPGGKTGTGSGSPITVSGLTGGQSYTFTVTATNASGTSPSSGASNAVTPTGLPGAPTGLSGTPSSGQVALSWTAPSNGGANITSYKIYQGTSSGGETLLLSTGNSNTTYTSTGLTNGTTYYYEVSAVNSVGEGSKSSEANATPGGVPGAPTGGNAYSETGHAQIYWTAPSNNGSPISSFSIYRSTTSGGETYIGSNGVTSYNDTSSGVTNTYYYEVAATNAFGQGPLSAEFSSTCQYGYWDGDGDGYGAGPAVAVCAAGTAMPGGYVSNDTDCYDSNANANPADTAFWGVNRGDGSFDYNCDGLQTSDAPSYVSTCTAEPDTVCTAYGLSGTTGACQEVSEYSTGALCTGNRQTGSFCRVVAQPGGYTGWQGSVPACGATGYMYGEEGTGLGSNGGYSWYCTGSECIGFYACDINFQEQNLCQ